MRIAIVAPPAALALLEIFHPHVHSAADILAVDMTRWLTIHYSQLVLFPLTALSVVLLMRGIRGIAAATARAMMFVFGVTFVAFDTAAGLVTAELARAANATPDPAAWIAPITAIWAHGIVGGVGSPLLAVAGTLSWTAGTVAAAIALKRVGGRWPGVILLALAPAGLVFFKSHAWPGGPLSFGACAAAGLLARRD